MIFSDPHLFSMVPADSLHSQHVDQSFHRLSKAVDRLVAGAVVLGIVSIVLSVVLG